MKPLTARLAKGDPSAFAELYDACAQRLHRYLLARLRRRDAAADVLQETFLRLVRAGKKIVQVENIESYVFRIAHNESQRWLRRHGRQRTECLVEIADEESDQSLENREEVEQLLQQLDSSSREVVELKFFGELSFSAIAKALRIPPGTVATRYRRALIKLRDSQEQKLS